MPTTNANTNIISKSCLLLTDDTEEGFTDRWICDKSWFQIMNTLFPHLAGAFNFRRRNIVLTGPFNKLNANKIYHKTFKLLCPYEGKRREVNFFLLSQIRHAT
jgi:hypothetical protein